MRYGYVSPLADARATAELAQLAEESGWDALFVSEPVYGMDAWMSLAAAAMVTERLRLGTMLTPLSRMRPWKLAGEVLTLDHLSNGRAILAAGLGATETGWDSFGEVTDRRARAELLDEGLEVVTGLWKGQPFAYSGKHYRVQEYTFFPPPPPVQRPRVPVWVVGAVGSKRSMARALKYDGLLPMGFDAASAGARRARQATREELRLAGDLLAARRANAGSYDVIVEGETLGDDPARGAAQVDAWRDAGATWWLETGWTAPDRNAIEARIRKGPPRLA